MGHTEKTHSEFYRRPNAVFQTAKISKLLMLLKSGNISKYKGKSLKDIDIDDTLVQAESDEEIYEQPLIPKCNENTSTNEETLADEINSVRIKKGSKRTLET